MWCKCKRLRAAVPVVHRVGVVRERLWRRYVSVGPVWFGCWGRRGWGMMEGGHWGATGGRHWAGGLHSCRLLLLIGTVVDRRVRCDSSSVGVWRLTPSIVNMQLSWWWSTEFIICFVLDLTCVGIRLYPYTSDSVSDMCLSLSNNSYVS